MKSHMEALYYKETSLLSVYYDIVFRFSCLVAAVQVKLGEELSFLQCSKEISTLGMSYLFSMNTECTVNLQILTLVS